MKTQSLFDKALQGIVFLCRIALCIFVGIVVVQALLAYPEAEFLQRTQSKGMLIGLVFSMAVFLALFFRGAYGLFGRLSERTLRIICIVIPCIMLGLQLLFLFYYRSLYMWDSAYVVGGASSLLTEGNVAGEAYYYLSVYPNQNAFVVLTKVLLWLAERLGFGRSGALLLLNGFNMLSLDIAVLFGVLTARKIGKRCFSLQGKDSRTKQECYRNWAFLWLVLMMQPFFYMGVSYYYTITLSMPWFMAFVYLAVRLFGEKFEVANGTEISDCSDQCSISEMNVPIQTTGCIKKNIILAVVLGITFAIGYSIRATMIIPLVAAVFCVLLLNKQEVSGVSQDREKQQGNRKFSSGRNNTAIISILLAVLVAVLSLVFLKPALAKQVGIDTTDTAFPTTHWLMMSLTSPGAHNAEDEAYTASFPTKEEKAEAVMIRMKEKLSSMDGKDALSLVWEKIKNTWASGSNCYVLFMENCLNMDGIYPYVFGHHKDFVILYHQGMHVLLLFGIVLSTLGRLFKRQEENVLVFFMQLILLGAFLFYVLWETSGQYSLPFFIVMILLALDGYGSLVRSAVEVSHAEIASDKTGKICVENASKADRRRYNMRKVIRFGFAGAGMLAIGICAVFFVKNIDIFTKQADTYTTPVVNQLLANEPVEVADGEGMVQAFKANQSFNSLVFQWRNPAGETNDAVYEVTLSDREGTVYWQQEIVLLGQGYQGAFLHEFPEIIPGENKVYELTIRKTEGRAESTLQVVTYTCGEYDAYPNGTLTINGIEQTGDMLLQISHKKNGAYTTVKRYVFFAGLCMIFFLFLEICCILQISMPTISDRKVKNG